MENEKVIEVLDEKLKGYKESFKAEVDASTKAWEEKVKDVNEQLAKKGATLEEIQTTLKEMQAKQGRIANTPTLSETKNLQPLFAAAIGDAGEQFKSSKAGEGISFQTKDVADMTTSTHHTGNVAITQANNVPPRGMFRHVRALLDVLNVDTLQYDYMREVLPAGEGSFGPQTEGSDKTQVDYDTLMISLTLAYEAGYATTTRQMLKNVRALQQILSRNLAEDFYRREDVKVLNALATAATAASTSETLTAAKIIDYIVQVDNAGYNANTILTTGAGWAAILKTKPSDFSVPGGVVISPSGDVMIAGIPVYKMQNVTSGKVYVGDFSKAYIVQGEAFSIRSSDQHSDNFTKNKVTFLAEAPTGVAIEAPSAFIYGAF